MISPDTTRRADPRALADSANAASVSVRWAYCGRQPSRNFTLALSSQVDQAFLCPRWEVDESAEHFSSCACQSLSAGNGCMRARGDWRTSGSWLNSTDRPGRERCRARGCNRRATLPCNECPRRRDSLRGQRGFSTLSAHRRYLVRRLMVRGVGASEQDLESDSCDRGPSWIDRRWRTSRFSDHPGGRNMAYSRRLDLPRAGCWTHQGSTATCGAARPGTDVYLIAGSRC